MGENLDLLGIPWRVRAPNPPWWTGMYGEDWVGMGVWATLRGSRDEPEVLSWFVNGKRGFAAGWARNGG